MKESQYQQILDACGGTCKPIAVAELKVLLQAWREVYAAGLFAETGRWKLGPYEWHVFSFEHARALNGDRALREYGERKPEAVVVYPEAVRLPACRLQGERLPGFGGHFVDLYVFPESLDWTMVFTHEASMGLGPYFSRREWVLPISEPQRKEPRRPANGR